MAKKPQFVDLTPPGEPARSFTIWLRKRDDGRDTQYWARRIVPVALRANPRNPYVWKALGTYDLEPAKAAAWKWLFTVHGKIADGRPLKVPTFREVAASWLKLLEARMAQVDERGQPLVRPSKYRRHEQCTRRYLVPFFGDMPITQIGTDEIDRWLEWRLHYFTEGYGKDETEVVYKRGGQVVKLKKKRTVRPADSTVQKDTIAFGEIVEHARLRMNVSFTIVPRLPLPKEHRDNRRPRFYPDEWKKLTDALDKRANTPIVKAGSRGGKRIKGGALSEKSEWSRRVLNYFVHFLHATGIRVAEAMWLQTRHLIRVPENPEYAAEVIGWLREGPEETGPAMERREALIQRVIKESYEYRIVIASDNPGLKQPIHARRVIPLREATACIDALLTTLWLELPKNITGNARTIWDLPDDLWLWCHSDGSRIASFANGFDAVLADTGLLMRDGKARSLTSIRHTYASERIEAGATANGLSLLADNMGTSVHNEVEV